MTTLLEYTLSFRRIHPLVEGGTSWIRNLSIHGPHDMPKIKDSKYPDHVNKTLGERPDEGCHNVVRKAWNKVTTPRFRAMSIFAKGPSSNVSIFMIRIVGEGPFVKRYHFKQWMSWRRALRRNIFSL